MGSLTYNELQHREVVTRFRGAIPPCLGGGLKWHTITSAGYFSPYNFTLNMINKDTLGKEKLR